MKIAKTGSDDNPPDLAEARRRAVAHPAAARMVEAEQRDAEQAGHDPPERDPGAEPRISAPTIRLAARKPIDPRPARLRVGEPVDPRGGDPERLADRADTGEGGARADGHDEEHDPVVRPRGGRGRSRAQASEQAAAVIRQRVEPVGQRRDREAGDHADRDADRGEEPDLRRRQPPVAEPQRPERQVHAGRGEEHEVEGRGVQPGAGEDRRMQGVRTGMRRPPVSTSGGDEARGRRSGREHRLGAGELRGRVDVEEGVGVGEARQHAAVRLGPGAEPPRPAREVGAQRGAEANRPERRGRMLLGPTAAGGGGDRQARRPGGVAQPRRRGRGAGTACRRRR